MSPTERKYVRGITPFWSWYKNITLFTARLPAINPVGLEVMLKLGEVARTVRDHELRDAGINPDLLPQWAGGSVLLSDQGETLTLLNTRGRNPFADIPFLGAGNVSETIQPYLKSFLESDLGMQMFGERPFSFDDSILTFGGRQIVFNPITGMPQEAPKARISTFLGQAIRSFPQVRLAEELVQGGEQRFFSPVPFTSALFASALPVSFIVLVSLFAIIIHLFSFLFHTFVPDYKRLRHILVPAQLTFVRGSFVNGSKRMYKGSPVPCLTGD